MPNANNKIEGTFTDLKKNLNTHSGLMMENRKRFISGFFLASAESLSMKKQKLHFPVLWVVFAIVDVAVESPFNTKGITPGGL